MATLTTLASFGGDDGARPLYGSLLADANGDLFGTTLSGGPTGDGSVFELVNTGSGYTLWPLASLDSTNGSSVFSGLAMDSSGNLFGVAQAGGATGQGTVFELTNTGSGYVLQTVLSFSGSNGAYPTGGLVADANGDLFGATQSGGANNQGLIFELVKDASGYSLHTLYSFNFTDGAAPTGPMIMDAEGDLFGTTLQGGAGGKGTVFELDHTGHLTTLATFDGSNGSYLYDGLVADAQGDLFGTTYSGGANGFGTVFELVHTDAGYTFEALASLDYFTTGGLPTGGLVIDGNGNLFGTAQAGGVGGFGTVFELVNTGSGYKLQTAYSFSGGLDGGSPKGTLIVDVDGNLYGTAASGGPDNAGTVFEIDLATPTDEQGALHLTVNSGSATPIGSIGAGHVGFVVGGMLAGDSGAVTFTDQAGHAVVVEVAAGQTHYTADFSTLTDGAVSASLQVATDAGGVSFVPVAGNTVTLDTLAPAQPAAPGDDAVSSGYVNAAHDTDGQTLVGTADAGALVTIFDNGAQVGMAVADGAGAWIHPVGVLADGTAHSFTVTATDAAGNVSAPSDALTFTVDTTAPAQPVAPGDASVSHGYVNAAHDTVGQAIGGTVEAGATVAVYDHGIQVATVSADGAGAWSYQVGALADGSSHSYTITATHAAGNTSGFSDTLSFVVDASAPSAPTGLADAAISGGYVNAAHDVAGQTLTGAAEGGALVTVFDNGVELGTATADLSTGAWNFVFGAFGDGAHAVTATATDAAGNVGAVSDALAFTVDTVAPGADVASVVTDGSAATTVSGSAEANATVTLFDGGAQVGVATAGLDGTWSYQVGVLADGSMHSYAVTATDAAGNTGALSDARTIIVGDDPAQPAAPGDAAVVNGYVNAAHDTAGQAIGGTTEANASVAIYDHETLLATVAADSFGLWTYSLGVLADGSSHSYAVSATDAAGNTSALSDPLNFTVDNRAPDAPAGLADAGVSHGYVNKAHDGAGQMVTGNAEHGAQVTVYDNGVKLGTAMADAATGAWSLQLGVLDDGQHGLTATATDAAGNTGAASAALNFTVDATAPVPVVDNVTDAGKGQSVVNGTSEAGSTVTLFDGGQQVGVTTAAADGAWSVTLKLNGGSVHQFTETAVDLAGNVGTSSGAAYWANPAGKAFVGGAGDDVLIGGKNSTLTGGAGHDHFVFDTGFGKQTVTDFTSGADQIWLNHRLFDSAASAMAAAHASGADTVITDSAGDQIVLQGVQPGALHAGDFLFF